MTPCCSPKLTASALLARLTSKKFTLPAYLWAAFPILPLVEFAVFGQASETVIDNFIQTRIVGRGMGATPVAYWQAEPHPWQLMRVQWGVGPT